MPLNIHALSRLLLIATVKLRTPTKYWWRSLALGVRHITTFTTYFDAGYVKFQGDPQPLLDEYGAAFAR